MHTYKENQRRLNNRFEREAGIAVILFHSFVSGPRPSSEALCANKINGIIKRNNSFLNSDAILNIIIYLLRIRQGKEVE